MAYKDFVNDRKKGILKDVLLFFGAEDFLMNWAVESIVNDYVDEAARDIDLIHLEGEQVTAADIMAQARAYSMFSERRVIVVRNYLPLFRKSADVNADELLKFAALPQDSSIVIFVVESRYSSELTSYCRKLAKACGSYEFARLERADLKSFITKRVHTAGKMIARRELDHMIDVTGYYNKGSMYDLAQLEKDTDKIVRACSGDAITIQLIEDILIGDSDRFVFGLVDALVAGDRGKALSIAEAIIRDEDGSMAVLALLTKQFEIMYDAIELNEKGYSISQMAKKTGVNEFRFKRAFNASGRYSKRRIGKILTELYNTDRDIKSGNIDKDVALELIAISACP
ncbi:MAG: DNA polymerase III subunit delta [Mogibacterium sp.]|nr:DNA polymerase III subunit delta [Mogibacterium sp.]MBR0343553.1 DNA polymerase III subunit delta [Oscillospiraceae bacterium]